VRFSLLISSAVGVVVIGTTLGVTADSWLDGDGKAGVEQLPVITPAQVWKAYPDAEVHGRLTLQDGCLRLGDSIVFWPLGTTWDATAEAVGFADKGTARVGQQFVGGGGVYSLDNINAALEAEPAHAIADCMKRTSSDGAVFAYPND
jgi:hypothetical protein